LIKLEDDSDLDIPEWNDLKKEVEIIHYVNTLVRIAG
jgi:hypothetical protein